MKNIVYAVIIAGGEGKRLWPKSNKLTPKHLLSFVKGQNLLEETFKRIKTKFPKDRILIVTTKKILRKTKSLLPELKKENFLIEPEGRNTAPAICFAAFVIERENPDAIMVVFPSDHIIKGQKNFLMALNLAIAIARGTDMLGTIGIRPSYPGTGYGYIKIGSRVKVPRPLESKRRGRQGSRVNCFKVERFVEKPSLAKATRYLTSKEYFWNSGIFIWKVSAILEAIKELMPKLYNSIKRIQNGEDISKVYKSIENISIDYCVMENSKDVFTVIGDFDWIDVGSWLSLDKLYRKDAFGNIVLANHRGINTEDSIIVGEDGHLVGTLGIKNLIIVNTKDATLVCSKDRAEEVKRLLI